MYTFSIRPTIEKVYKFSGTHFNLLLFQGCETKDTKVVNLCLQVIQRLITSKVLDAKGAKYVVETMWMLMEANIEEVIIKNLSLIML